MSNSYSQLFLDISSGSVSSLEMYPERQFVIVTYTNNKRKSIPIFSNDQKLIRSSIQYNVPLEVKDLSKQEALSSIFSNLAVFLIIILGIILLLKRSLKIANTTFGFGKSLAKIKADENIQTTFDDVAGISEATEELREIIDFLIKPDSLNQLGAKVPKGILLVGSPGTGKTLLAKAIAGEAGVPFFSISASEFVEMFVGVGASRVRDLFKQAKTKSPCIVFIDEIDAVGRQRGAGIGVGNDEREQTLNQLLTEMDGFGDNSGIILLAATNRPDILDTALTRPGRFDRRIDLLLPDKKGRKEILGIHARTKPLNNNISLTSWADRTIGFSGAQLENLLNESAIIAARDDTKCIEDSHINHAFERLTLGIASQSILDHRKKILLAYRESARAVVAEYSECIDKIDKITILPRSNKKYGSVRFLVDSDIVESGLYTKSYLNNKLVVILAARAAEILIYGSNEITQYSSNDLESVTSIAREMVTRFGFSKLGPISLGSQDSNVFLGKDLLSNSNTYAQSTLFAIDQEVNLLAKNALHKAIIILKDKRNLLDHISEVLVEKETISSQDFQKLIIEKDCIE